MRQNRIAVAFVGLLGVLGTGAAEAELRARLAVDKAWLAQTDDVVARVVITNTSDKAMKVPGWQVPQAELDANLFDVTRDGAPVRYLGRLAKRPVPGPGEFVILEPGKSLRGRTELTRHYDMVQGGEYVVSYRMDLLEGVDIDELRVDADMVGSNAVSVWRDAPVHGDWDVDAMNAPITMAGSLAYTNCSSSQQSSVASAVGSAKTYSTGSKNYLAGKTWSTVGARYTTWFGAKSSNNFNTVKSHFTSIESAFLNQAVVVDCGCTQNYYAYVYPTQPYKIYVCNAFWSAPSTGTDSKAGTLVHEMSHFNVVAGTDDHAYGQTACKTLANKKPSRAIDNADSHEYFAENTPALN